MAIVVARGEWTQPTEPLALERRPQQGRFCYTLVLSLNDGKPF